MVHPRMLHHKRLTNSFITLLSDPADPISSNNLVTIIIIIHSFASESSKNSHKFIRRLTLTKSAWVRLDFLYNFRQFSSPSLLLAVYLYGRCQCVCGVATPLVCSVVCSREVGGGFTYACALNRVESRAHRLINFNLVTVLSLAQSSVYILLVSCPLPLYTLMKKTDGKG